MASVKVSALVTGFKGKLRGSVMQFTAAGQVMRSNKYFNRVGSVSFQNAKTNTQTTIGKWQALTSAQRASWGSATANFPTTTRFGDSRIPSAYTLFLRLNRPLLYHNATFNSTAPAPWSFSNIGPVSATKATPTSALDVSITNAYTSNERLIIRASPPLSPGRNNPNNKYVTIAYLNTPSTLVNDVTTAYTNTFGYLPSGMKAYFRVQLLSIPSGQLSTPFIAFLQFP